MKDPKNRYIGRCRDCDINIHQFDDYAIFYNGELICETCYREYYFICDGCWEIWPTSECYLGGPGDSDLMLCPECLESGRYNICISCLDPYPVEELAKGEQCEICKEKNEGWDDEY